MDRVKFVCKWCGEEVYAEESVCHEGVVCPKCDSFNRVTEPGETCSPPAGAPVTPAAATVQPTTEPPVVQATATETVASPDSRNARTTKQCPYCAEEILVAAVKCKHCGEWLTAQRSTTPDLPAPTDLRSSASRETKKRQQFEVKYKWLALVCGWCAAQLGSRFGINWIVNILIFTVGAMVGYFTGDGIDALRIPRGGKIALACIIGAVVFVLTAIIPN
jgi:hypothetical protein